MDFSENIRSHFGLVTKGQLISKCPFGVFKSTKKTNKIFVRSSVLAPKKRSNQKKESQNKIIQLVV